MEQPRILLIVTGGIAAYKVPELVRALRTRGYHVRCVMTQAAKAFVSPLVLASLSGEKVHTELFNTTDEAEMGHISLSRQADLLVVVPATAHILAKMAAGMADDLASTLLLATDTPVLVCPAMNVRMWHHPATQRNLATLAQDGVHILPPDSGAMACGEYGDGRLPDVAAIVEAIDDRLHNGRALADKSILITAGPTHEPIDPVRYIANRSSGKQGYAIAAACARAGARVRLISGPVNLPAPLGVDVRFVETAAEMARAVAEALPVDVAILAAAVADWSPRAALQKVKKSGAAPYLELHETQDILQSLCHAPNRPCLVIGFAAETEDLEVHAQAKRLKKGCDWLLANDVSGDVMGGAENEVLFLHEKGSESWPRMSKEAVAARLVERIIHGFSD
jgi:phosphopantothenoylcysteine decarboxylase / phosphopantothenate---cysteine ligase